MFQQSRNSQSSVARNTVFWSNTSVGPLQIYCSVFFFIWQNWSCYFILKGPTLQHHQVLLCPIRPSRQSCASTCSLKVLIRQKKAAQTWACVRTMTDYVKCEEEEGTTRITSWSSESANANSELLYCRQADSTLTFILKVLQHGNLVTISSGFQHFY